MATMNLMTSPGPGCVPMQNQSNGGLTLDQATCDMVACGAIPKAILDANMATPPGLPAMSFPSACTAAGYGGPQGGRFCSDPVCAPYKPQILSSGWGQALECCVADGGQWNGSVCLPPAQPMPSATQSTMPSITDTANIVAPVSPQPPQLTPAFLTAKLPSIVNPQPINMAPACTTDGFSTWVGSNPLLAAGGLAVLALMLFSDKRR